VSSSTNNSSSSNNNNNSNDDDDDDDDDDQIPVFKSLLPGIISTSLSVRHFRISCRTPIRVPRFVDVGVAHSSQVRAAALLVTSTVGNLKLWRLGGV
jgi:hypothetical protein